jgi:hypothetical protein
MNTYSKNLIETLLDSIPNYSWKSLDQDGDTSTKADYEIKDSTGQMIIVELKELQNPQEFDDQFSISQLIEKEFKGIIPDISFSCFFGISGEIPNQNQINLFKRFLELVAPIIVTPCRIALPTDAILKPLEVVKVERYDEHGSLLQTEFFPKCISERFPRGLGDLDRTFRSRAKCRVTIGQSETEIFENDLFTFSERAILEMQSSDLQGSYILGPSIGGSINESARIRGVLGKAREQLKVHLSLNCPLGAVICSSGLLRADFEDLEDALYGDPQIEVLINSKGKDKDTKLVHGGNRFLQAGKNTTFSFIGWLYEENKIGSLKIIHNEFGQKCVPIEFFNYPQIQNYIMEYKLRDKQVVGTLVKVSSSEHFEEIRKENEGPVRLIKRC